MKKATKVFVCLFLFMLLIFSIASFTAKFFPDKVAELLSKHTLVGEDILCEMTGGRVFGQYTGSNKICVLKNKDFEKKCKNNEDCEGYCVLKNKDIIRDKLSEIEKGSFYISTNEFEKKTGIKIEEGYCSSGIHEYWCNEPEAFIENGMVHTGTQYSCGDYPRFK